MRDLGPMFVSKVLLHKAGKVLINIVQLLTYALLLIYFIFIELNIVH